MKTGQVFGNTHTYSSTAITKLHKRLQRPVSCVHRICTRVSRELHCGLLLLPSESEHYNLYRWLRRNPLAHGSLPVRCLDLHLYLLHTGYRHIRKGLLNLPLNTRIEWITSIDIIFYLPFLYLVMTSGSVRHCHPAVRSAGYLPGPRTDSQRSNKRN